LLVLLLLAGSASALTVGPVRERPVTGRALEVNIPFSVDAPTERACASANVRYGNALAPRSTLHVQGHGLKRNLLVTSRVNVNGATVMVNVRVGCGPKAVTRSFVLLTSRAAANSPAVTLPVIRPAAPEFPATARQKPVRLVAPVEPLFPPPGPEALPQEDDSRSNADATMAEELRQARSEAGAASAKLEATRKELAAVLDIERRTSQTLIDADRQVRDARSEVAHMRQVLVWLGAAMGLGAAGLAWLEFGRVAFRRRTSGAPAVQEPTMLSGLGEPA
jgi:hypothetical protein